MLSQMTKKEYERTHVRAQEEEGDSLLPAVIFSFSKKKCEEIADFLKGQDLLNAKEKGEVRHHNFKIVISLNILLIFY